MKRRVRDISNIMIRLFLGMAALMAWCVFLKDTVSFINNIIMIVLIVIVTIVITIDAIVEVINDYDYTD